MIAADILIDTAIVSSGKVVFVVDVKGQRKMILRIYMAGFSEAQLHEPARPLRAFWPIRLTFF